MLFREKYSFAMRLAESKRIREKFPTHIPIVMEPTSSAVKDAELILDKPKYLISRDLCMHSLMFFIRKRMRLPPEKALFMFCGGTMLPASTLMSEVYKKYQDADGFVYITYSGESVFG